MQEDKYLYNITWYNRGILAQEHSKNRKMTLERANSGHKLVEKKSGN